MRAIRLSAALVSVCVLSAQLFACGDDEAGADGPDSGTGGTAGSGGSGGTAGSAGSGGQTPIDAGPDARVPRTGPFADMAPELGVALPETDPGQWVWQSIEGAICRDGSPAGFYLKRSTASKNLMIYLDGGGVCFNSPLCALNAKNVRERVYGEAFVPEDTALLPRIERDLAEPALPHTDGIFDTTNTSNPVRDWNMVFVPYCTGDVHAGTRRDVQVPGDTSGAKQQFVGYLNMQKYVARLVPTFQDAERVLLTGTSAGGFGAGMNFNQVQDAFKKVGSAKVTVVMDSAVIYDDKYLPACLQKQWRELWGLNAALPPDCPECQQASGAGFYQLIYYSADKYPASHLGVISGTRDTIMRIFMSYGMNECGATTEIMLPPAQYETALLDIRDQLLAQPGGERYASYYIGGGAVPNATRTTYDLVHQWLPFDRFYSPLAGGTSPAQFVADLLRDEPTSVGP